MKSVKEESIVIQLAVVATMMPKVKEYIDQQADRIAELERQTKPLSEKELYEVFDKCYPNNGDGDVVTLVDFARAIEERHGIK